LPFTDDALVACEKLNIEKLTTVKTSASVKPNLFAITCPFFFRGFLPPWNGRGNRTPSIYEHNSGQVASVAFSSQKILRFNYLHLIEGDSGRGLYARFSIFQNWFPMVFRRK
jgi:hypothetical protein